MKSANQLQEELERDTRRLLRDGLRLTLIAAAGITVTAAVANLFLALVLWLANVANLPPGSIVFWAVVLTIAGVVVWFVIAAVADETLDPRHYQ